MKPIPRRAIKSMVEQVMEIMKNTPGGEWEVGFEVQWIVDKEGNASFGVDLAAEGSELTEGIVGAEAAIETGVTRSSDNEGTGKFWFRKSGRG